MDIEAIRLKPLDGKPEGSEVTLSADDFHRLEGYTAVKRKPGSSKKVAAVAEAETPQFEVPARDTEVLESRDLGSPVPKGRGRKA